MKKIALLFLVVGIVAAALFVFAPKDEEQINEPVPQISQAIQDPVFKEITKEEYEKYKPTTSDAAEPDCPFVPDFLARRDCYEKAMFEKYSNVTRVNGCLHLSLKNGTKKELCDIEAEGYYNEKGEVGVKYTFAGYVSNLGYLINGTFYEGGTTVVIDERTGQEIKFIMGTPAVSPNGSKFVATSSDLEAGYRPNGFELWAREGDIFVKKINRILDDRQHPEGFFGMSDPVWVNENTFYFQKHNFPSPSYEYVTTYGSYSF